MGIGDADVKGGHLELSSARPHIPFPFFMVSIECMALTLSNAAAVLHHSD